MKCTTVINDTTSLGHMTREQLINGLRKGDKAAVKTAISILNDMPVTNIPDGYHYDTETATMLVYRHKYTGDEMHIRKPIQLCLPDGNTMKTIITK
jgi:hypothetical protein